MHPVLIRIGSISISSYSFMLLIAFLVSYLLSAGEFKRKGLPDSLRDYILIACVIGGLVGAKLLFIYENATLGEFLSNPLRYFASGLTFLGGFVGAVILVWVVVMLAKQRFLRITDAISPLTVISYGVARVGCFLVGDDYGIPSNLPWAIAFPNGSPPTLVKVHPTQIYEIIMAVVIFAFLWRIRKTPRPDGWLTGVTFVLLGVERMLIEVIRTTTPSFIPGLTVAQLMSLALIAIGVVLIVLKKGGVTGAQAPST